MGLYLNGSKIAQPYLNGSKVNGYLNGSKLWNSTRYLAITDENGIDILTETNSLLLTEQKLKPIPELIIPEGTSILPEEVKNNTKLGLTDLKISTTNSTNSCGTNYVSGWYNFIFEYLPDSIFSTYKYWSLELSEWGGYQTITDTSKITKVKTKENQIIISINCEPNNNNCYYANGVLGKNRYTFQKFHGWMVDDNKPRISIHLKGNTVDSERSKIWVKLIIPADYSDSNVAETITLLDVITLN